MWLTRRQLGIVALHDDESLADVALEEFHADGRGRAGDRNLRTIARALPPMRLLALMPRRVPAFSPRRRLRKGQREAIGIVTWRHTFRSSRRTPAWRVAPRSANAGG